MAGIAIKSPRAGWCENEGLNCVHRIVVSRMSRRRRDRIHRVARSPFLSALARAFAEHERLAASISSNKETETETLQEYARYAKRERMIEKNKAERERGSSDSLRQEQSQQEETQGSRKMKKKRRRG